MHYSPGYSSPRLLSRGFHRPIGSSLLLYKVCLWGHTSCRMLGNGGPEFLVPDGLWPILGRTVAQSVKGGGGLLEHQTEQLSSWPGWPPRAPFRGTCLGPRAQLRGRDRALLDSFPSEGLA